MFKVKLPFSSKDGSFEVGDEISSELAEEYAPYVIEVNKPKAIETKRKPKSKKKAD